MSSINNIAEGFSITGLLDADSKTKNKFPIKEIPIDEIHDHPDNITYSMDSEAIQSLSSSILRSGLTDLPLVRKLDDGTWQMLSGHRRKAAYKLLSQDDPSFSLLPCRVIDNITDEQSKIILHSANFFVRSLTITERAAASRELNVQAKKLLKEDPNYKGQRTDDIKADIISQTTGKNISARSIRRTEKLARQIENDLSDQWKELALNNKLTDTTINKLAQLDREQQQDILKTVDDDEEHNKNFYSKLIENFFTNENQVDKNLKACLTNLQKYAKKNKDTNENEIEVLRNVNSILQTLLQS